MLDLRQERALADRLAHKLNPDHHAQWLACRSTHRFMAGKGTTLVLFQKRPHGVEVIKTLVCKSVTLQAEGFQSEWETSQGENLVAGHSPCVLGNGCFLYHPFGSEVQFLERSGVWGPRFSMIYRTRYNPAELHVGCFYLLEKQIFDLSFGT